MKKRLLGIIILILLIGGTIFIKSVLNQNNTSIPNLLSSGEEERKTVKIATFDLEKFFLDEQIKEIINTKYKFDLTYDKLSNEEITNNSLLNEKISNYDLLFSNKEILDSFKLEKNDEAENKNLYEVVLNTPLVIYSWDEVVDVLISENIVTEKDGVYYITDMNKLITYILEEKKWEEIGLDTIYGNINIASANPVTNYSGASFYGLLLSIMSKETSNMEENFPKLKEIYEKNEYMSNNQETLFDRYVRLGMTAVPMFADYEKSIIEFANSSPDAFNQIKSDVRILYPSPTVLEEFCITSFTENGKAFNNVFSDSELQKIVWEKFGLRNLAGNYEITKFNGVLDDITDTVTLDKNIYEDLISYFSENN